MRRAGAICQGSAARVFTNPWGLTVRTYTGFASTAPLVDSDFPQYLSSLYLYGWRMVVSRKQHVLAGDVKPRSQCVSLHSPEGLTRSVIRWNIVSGVEMPSQVTDGRFKVSLLGWLEALLAEQAAKTVPPPLDPVRVPIKPVPLPPAPPIPASPPPSVTAGDVKTYVAPDQERLGPPGNWVHWAIRAVPPTHHGHGLSRLPSLTRAYRFTTPSAARHFLHAAVSLMPVPTPWILAQAWDSNTFGLGPISKLAPNAPFKYGISLADVHFAIDVDNEFYRNWVGRADNIVFPDRYIPKSAMDVWKFRARTFNSW
ncbi:hypothetical protein DFH07DRAFT_842051 [Mycena maculata]|uniref:Uncharacterized protein n=1 Tax=Mycena maculata TaxID=230809 RepID=A0AAD7I8S4_9AGAR|nr:hypothetical protein DFH07DRAFT_842051 [Mycena maculata]